ncbi:hypothetical protein BJX65DRAFT_273532, partial [Aspergillus insuetus]
IIFFPHRHQKAPNGKPFRWIHDPPVVASLFCACAPAAVEFACVADADKIGLVILLFQSHLIFSLFNQPHLHWFRLHFSTSSKSAEPDVIPSAKRPHPHEVQR